MLIHITQNRLPRGFIIHYIDDIMFGGKDYDMRNLILNEFLQVCKLANVEIKHSKTEGPVPQLIMIGFDFFCHEQPLMKVEKLHYIIN